ncbi:phosphatase PAP2 family protein [bacterium]|nr:phosphatase PAP2 family protein [bacterium]
MKLVDSLFIVYNIIVSILILIKAGSIPGWYIYIVVHLSLILIPVLYQKAESSTILKNRSDFLRYWYPYLFFGLFYSEIGLINTVYIKSFQDHFFVEWDFMLFGFHPSLEFMNALPGKLFSEYMYFSYFSYFVFIEFLAIVYWIKKNKKEFVRIAFTISFGYFFCYIIFIFLPVGGPRFTFPGTFDIEFKGYFFARILELIMKNAEIKGAAFPSSHCAIAALVSLESYRINWWTGVLVTLIALGLFCGTVYGRFHYVVDVIFGIGVGILMFILVPYLYRFLQGKRKSGTP